jgi:superfamily II DNA/RNA helicase
MLDMGFIPDIERIGKLVPFTRQTLFFTATMPPEIQHIADNFLHNPARVEVSRPATTADTITQLLVATGREDFEKRDTLRRLIRSSDGFKNAIVFCNRKREVATLLRSLQRHKFNAVALHGDMDQPARMAALDRFKKGDADLLIASDVAARGLDIPDVSHVFNFDVPHHPDDYVHRIGRTGRAGKSGTAITIVAPSDQKSLAAIERLTGQSIKWADGPPADEAASASTPREESRGRGRERGRQRGGRGRSRENRSGDSNHARQDQNQEHQREQRPESRQDAEPRRAASPPADKPAAKPPRPANSKPGRGRNEQHQPSHDEPDTSHLPAFLLRPVSIKA